MTVTTTTPARASRAPSYHDNAPEPVVKLPPWTHTITGCGPDELGAHTFRRRQSSESTSPRRRGANADAGCGHLGPHSRQRFELEIETTSGPRTGPEVVSTTRSACTDGVSCQAVGVLIASTSTFIGTDLAGTAAAFAAFGMFS